MKVAVCAHGEGMRAGVDGRFGRCPYFVIADVDSKDADTVSNPATRQAGGAGVRAAQFLSQCRVEAVLAGNVGPNAVQALHAAGLDIYTGITGTVQDSVEMFIEGELKKAEAPNVGAHRGQRGMGRRRGGFFQRRGRK